MIKLLTILSEIKKVHNRIPIESWAPQEKDDDENFVGYIRIGSLELGGDVLIPVYDQGKSRGYKITMDKEDYEFFVKRLLQRNNVSFEEDPDFFAFYVSKAYFTLEDE